MMKQKVRKVLLVLFAVGVSYFISGLLQINHFAWTLLKSRYYQYISLFLPLLAVWCCIYSYIRLDGKAGFIRASLTGLIGGYLCSLLAFLLLPIYRSHSVHQIFQTSDLSTTLFLSPLVALTWVTGILSAWVIWGAWTKWNMFKSI